jgi:hypothetical protein
MRAGKAPANGLVRSTTNAIVDKMQIVVGISVQATRFVCVGNVLAWATLAMRAGRYARTLLNNVRLLPPAPVKSMQIVTMAFFAMVRICVLKGSVCIRGTLAPI